MSTPAPASASQKTAAQQSDITQVLLKCESNDMAVTQAFCTKLTRALMDQGLVVAPYAGQAPLSLSANQVIVETVDLRRTNLGLSLNLAWTYGATGQSAQSERFGLRVMDAPLSVEMYDRFIDGFVQPDVLPFL